MADSAVSRLRARAHADGLTINWRTNGLCSLTGYPIVVLEVWQRRKRVAHATCSRIKNTSIDQARECCAEAVLG